MRRCLQPQSNPVRLCRLDPELLESPKDARRQSKVKSNLELSQIVASHYLQSRITPESGSNLADVDANYFINTIFLVCV